eukprot:3687847-Rhodomonas_salina.1
MAGDQGPVTGVMAVLCIATDRFQAVSVQGSMDMLGSTQEIMIRPSIDAARLDWRKRVPGFGEKEPASQGMQKSRRLRRVGLCPAEIAHASQTGR